MFVRASESDRLAHMKQLQGLSDELARRRLKQIDANRGAYIRQVYDHDWLHPSHYHMVLDSGRLGYERAADAIVAVAQRRYGFAAKEPRGPGRSKWSRARDRARPPGGAAHVRRPHLPVMGAPAHFPSRRPPRRVFPRLRRELV